MSGGDRPGLARPLLSLLACLACAAGAVALARAAVGTPRGQRLDQLILSGAETDQGRSTTLAELAVDSVSVPVVLAILAVTTVLVLVRRRADLLVPLGALVAGANVTTQVIKSLVVEREALATGIDITPNSFPSGHTALAASAAVALVIAAGRGRWVLTPLAVLWTAAAGIGTLVVSWHRPSDVVGAILVVAAWTFLVLAVDGLLARRGRRDPEASTATATRGRRRAGRATRTPGADVAVAVLLGVVGLGASGLGAVTGASLTVPLQLEDAAQQELAYHATSALIVGGTALWFALVLVLRAPRSRGRGTPGRVP